MIGQREEFGLTLVEVLVSIVLLSIVLIPAISALQTSIVGANVHDDLAGNHFRISSRLEELLTESFSDLEDAAIAAGGSSVETSYSEPVGPPARLLVFIAYYDGDNADSDNDPFTGADVDLMWIRVEAEGTVHALQTITARGH